MKMILTHIVLLMAFSCVAQKHNIDLEESSFFTFQNPKGLVSLTFENHSNKSRKMYVLREKSGKYAIFSSADNQTITLSEGNLNSTIRKKLVNLKDLDGSDLTTILIDKLKLDTTNKKIYLVEVNKRSIKLIPIKIFFEGLYEI